MIITWRDFRLGNANWAQMLLEYIWWPVMTVNSNLLTVNCIFLTTVKYFPSAKGVFFQLVYRQRTELWSWHAIHFLFHNLGLFKWNIFPLSYASLQLKNFMIMQQTRVSFEMATLWLGKLSVYTQIIVQTTWPTVPWCPFRMWWWCKVHNFLTKTSLVTVK